MRMNEDIPKHLRLAVCSPYVLCTLPSTKVRFDFLTFPLSITHTYTPSQHKLAVQQTDAEFASIRTVAFKMFTIQASNATCAKLNLSGDNYDFSKTCTKLYVNYGRAIFRND